MYPLGTDNVLCGFIFDMHPLGTGNQQFFASEISLQKFSHNDVLVHTFIGSGREMGEGLVEPQS